MHSFQRSAARRALSAGAAVIVAATSVVAVPVSRIIPPAVADAAGSFADPHFTEDQVFTNLTMPTTVRFASDGRAFVAEKRGIIKEYDNIGDNSPTPVLDIRSDVHDYWDRGLLSIALDPDFLNGRPYLYVYYVYDAPPGKSAPYWNDACPNPPGGTQDGCVVRSKLDRYTVNLSSNVASGRVNLLGDGSTGEWCQQYPSHAGGALAFDADGMLLVSGGDGASFSAMDYGNRAATCPIPRTPSRPSTRAMTPWTSRRIRAIPRSSMARPPRAACSARRTCARRATRRGSTAPSRGSTRHGQLAGGQPAQGLRGRRREHQAHRRDGLPQPVPDDVPARPQRPVRRRRRQPDVGGGRSLDDVGQHAGQHPELRLAVLRGQQPSGRVRECRHRDVRRPVRRWPVRAAVHVHARRAA